MSKSNKLVTTVLLGAAGGAAAAVFLASKSGKAIKEKWCHFIKDYQDDPEAQHTKWADKVNDLKDQAVERYSDVRQKFETSQLHPDELVETVKDKATELKDRVSQDDFFIHLKDQATKLKETIADSDIVDGDFFSEDITIDLTEADDSIGK